MAGIKVAVGEEYFEELRKNGCYYVDKTEMIYQIAAGGGARVTLFTRPRRFGKTLTMTMLRSFFDLARESKDVLYADFLLWYRIFPENGNGTRA